MRVQDSVTIQLKSAPAEFHTFTESERFGENIAVTFGSWGKEKAPLVRIHSECMTGDLFGSAHCDCGEQLQECLERFENSPGILLYLRQEGRGIGLYNKLKAYRLQAQGMDTFEANRELGFSDDERDYTVAADMLRALGVSEIRLITNNPEKMEQLKRHGITIRERIPTGIHLKPENRRYLTSKIQHSRHLLELQSLRAGEKKSC